MKLSEAIRKGCEMVPRQCKGWGLDKDNELESCALGAAHYVMYQDKDAVNTRALMRDIRESFPGISEHVFTTVTGMNDTDGKTREEIADWLEEQGL